MRTNAYWCAKTWAIAVVFAMVFMALSCGGNGASVDLDATIQGQNAVGSQATSKSTGLIVTENEIASLPAWQQELLSDPGWNQPYIQPRAHTEIEAPTMDMLLEATREAMEAGVEIVPRAQSFGKNASWTNQGGFGGETIIKGEYPFGPRDTNPDYGCNTDGSNEAAGGNAIEDLIAQNSMPLQRISYVLEGLSTANYFNATGGSGNDMQTAIYQLYADDRDADPSDLNSKAQMAELCYNSGLLGSGIGPTGDCTAAEAYQLEGKVWKRFNSRFRAMPGLASTPLYNIFIAPAGELSSEVENNYGTTARTQPFYFGTVSSCYGGAMIVSIVDANTSCGDFDTNIANSATDATDLTFTNPVYGVLMQRWVDTNPGAPWDGPLGWPVFGPRAFDNGAPQLAGSGEYFAWGMWFTKGFIWWIDYVDPNASDEAIMYLVSGNVYCDNDYQIQPAVFYGGTGGDLEVNVNLESYSYNGTDYFPLPFNGTNYELALPDDGLGTANVRMFASATGGVTRSGADVGHPEWGDCLYKHYVWSYRNGFVQAAGTAYDPAQRYGQASYGGADNRQSMYTVRVQVTDAQFDEGISGSEIFAYGDSFPLHVGSGSGGGGGGGEILVVRNDGGTYDANWDALLADLDAIGASYSTMDYVADIDDTYFSDGYLSCIWYRGGPGTAGEPNFTSTWATAEWTDMFDICAGGGNVLAFSQSQASTNYNSVITPNWWRDIYGGITGPEVALQVPHAHGQNEGMWANDANGLFFGSNGYSMFANSIYYGDFSGAGFGAFSTNAAERYNGTGSSGDVPSQFSMGNFQFGSRTRYQPFDGSGFAPNPGWSNGITAPGGGVGGLDATMVSWGTTSCNPGASWQSAGPGKYWCTPYAWAAMTITNSGSGSMERADMLQNLLAWSNDALSFGGGGGGGGGGGFAAYDGLPGDWAIVQIKPVFWADDGSYVEGSSANAGNSPLPGATDAFRSTPNGPDENYVVRTAGAGNEDGFNGNDTDFSAPFYGYHHFGPNGLDDGGAGDDILSTGGLLVENPGGDWVIQNTPDPGYFNNPVANWYVNASGNVDAGVRATYGTGGSANLFFDGQGGFVTYESIARWPGPDSSINGPLLNNGADAYLRWSLFPGHGVYDTTAVEEFGIDQPWSNYLGYHDVDMNGTNSPDRDDTGWLRPIFQFPGANDPTYGRIIDFDYRGIDGWRTDFDGNGANGDLTDRFPVRARLVTDWSAYIANNGLLYPNQMPDPGSFLELAAYVVDTSAGDPGLIIFDDLTEPDPGFGGTLDKSGWPSVTLDVFYGISGGTPNYDVDLCYDFDPGAGVDLVDSFAIAEGLGDTVAVAAGLAGPGFYSQADVTFSPDAGDAFVAMRVTDGLGDQSVFWYPDAVTFGPPFSIAILEDNFSLSPNAFNKLVADVTDAYGAGAVTSFDISSPLGAGALNGFDAVLWASDGWTESSEIANFNVANAASEVLNACLGGSVVLIAGEQAMGLRTNTFITQILPWSDTTTQWEDGNGAPNFFTNGVQSTPLACAGYDTWNAATGHNGQHINWSGTEGTVTKCVTGYATPPSTTYVSGAFRTGLGSGGACVAIALNYGDLADNMTSNTRANHLVNLLCMNNLFSPFNPSPPPPPAELPFFDDFESGFAEWIGADFIAAAPSNPGTYPAFSGSNVARYINQPYNTDNLFTTFGLSSGGRAVPAGGGGLWEATWRYNGDTESTWDYFYVDLYINGGFVTGGSFTGNFTGPMAQYTFGAFAANDGDLVDLQFTLFSDSIFSNYYGPQVDDVSIDVF